MIIVFKATLNLKFKILRQTTFFLQLYQVKTLIPEMKLFLAEHGNTLIYTNNISYNIQDQSLTTKVKMSKL